MTAFYNEINEEAAAWLRELIAEGHIAPGVVDTRDIRDIRPEELYGFTQCHFFAGIGVWSYALRRAGWPDHRRVWTGSCPCQPFSAAGAGGGFDDERHLWPHFYWLIANQRDLPTVFGEQVASKAADPWIDLVQDDMEALGYAVGAIPFPSAGVGAPHIRDRLYWVADAADQRQQRRRASDARNGRGAAWVQPQRLRHAGELGDAQQQGLAQRIGQRGIPGGARGADAGQATERAGVHVGGLADTGERGLRGLERRGPALQHADDGAAGERPGPVNGLWRAADWLLCRDGRWRPVEPGTFPLAHGAAARVGRLRGYGNAINAEAALAFIEAADDAFAVLRG